MDVTYDAPLPAACPDCGGAIQRTRVAPQYQEDLPAVRPIVRRFDVHVGCCVACGRRVQGRHPLQTLRQRGEQQAAQVEALRQQVEQLAGRMTHLAADYTTPAATLRAR